MTEDRTMTMRVGGFSDILGCFSGDKEIVHVGQLFSRITACGKPMEDTILSKDFTVTCQGCIDEAIYRSNHPKAARKPMGEVMHKGHQEVTK
jgi:hypothetical protein